MFLTNFKMTLVTLELYAFATLSIKTSILLLYKRYFSPSRLARNMIRTGLVLISLFYVSVIMANLIILIPRGGQPWLSTSLNQHNGLEEYQLSIVQGVFGVTSDSYLLSIPLIQVVKLHVSRSQKIGLATVFLTGLL